MSKGSGTVIRSADASDKEEILKLIDHVFSGQEYFASNRSSELKIFRDLESPM